MSAVSFKTGDGFVPGVWPRLISGSTATRELNDLDALTKEITANIESILNSRSRPSFKELDGDPALHFSVIGMGIDDFCGCHHNDRTIARIRSEMTEQIKHFEPRLDPESLVVKVNGEDENRRGSLIMEISGRINVKPFDEEYMCCYQLDLETGIPMFRKTGDHT